MAEKKSKWKMGIHQHWESEKASTRPTGRKMENIPNITDEEAREYIEKILGRKSNKK